MDELVAEIDRLSGVAKMVRSSPYLERQARAFVKAADNFIEQDKRSKRGAYV
jgi:hypothetical protein